MDVKPVSLLGIDSGNPSGIAIFFGPDYLDSFETEIEGSHANRLYELAESLEFVPDSDNLFYIFDPHVLVCEKLFVGRAKEVDGGKYFYKNSLKLAEMRGALLGRINCSKFYEPHPKTWKQGRSDKCITMQMQAIVDEARKKDDREPKKVGDHEAAAMAMCVWALGEYKTDSLKSIKD